MLHAQFMRPCVHMRPCARFMLHIRKSVPGFMTVHSLYSYLENYCFKLRLDLVLPSDVILALVNTKLLIRTFTSLNGPRIN